MVRYFSRRNCQCDLLERNRPARQATINRRAAAWGEGVGYTFGQEEAVSLQDWTHGREICRRKPKNIIVLVCLHDVAQQGEPDQNIRQRSGTPRGRRHAATSADLSIPTRKVGLKRARVGGGCIAMITSMRGGEVKRDLISREQKVCVTWNLCLNFF